MKKPIALSISIMLLTQNIFSMDMKKSALKHPGEYLNEMLQLEESANKRVRVKSFLGAQDIEERANRGSLKALMRRAEESEKAGDFKSAYRDYKIVAAKKLIGNKTNLIKGRFELKAAAIAKTRELSKKGLLLLTLEYFQKAPQTSNNPIIIADNEEVLEITPDIMDLVKNGHKKFKIALQKMEDDEKAKKIQFPCDKCNKKCLSAGGLAKHKKVHEKSILKIR